MFAFARGVILKWVFTEGNLPSVIQLYYEQKLEAFFYLVIGLYFAFRHMCVCFKILRATYIMEVMQLNIWILLRSFLYHILH